jgi:dihydrofolate synthase/folylpolyglutamate synthase
MVVASWEAVKSVHHGDREPTFFEFSTAMAFHEFARQGVDYAVSKPAWAGGWMPPMWYPRMLSIITNISLEHKTYLGDTIAAITGEKAGIIKPGIPGGHRRDPEKRQNRHREDRRRINRPRFS